MAVSVVDDLSGRIEAACVGALAGEAVAGVAAGAADLLGVAESAAASGGFVEADLRQRGLERPSRSGPAGLLLRALPFGMLTPLDRPRLRRDAYRCVSLAGADEGTAVAAVAAAILVADLMRFDVHTALVRVRQSLLEDAPMALLERLTPQAADAPPEDGTADAVLQAAISAIADASTVQDAVDRAGSGPPVAVSMAGALAGAHLGRAATAGIDVEQLSHGDRALQVARRLGERAEAT
ncbi:MAG: hypothetical protein ABR498_08125 [Candidatus Dormibacteria bacterium]